MHRERLVRAVVGRIPEAVLASPERILINASCALIGLFGLFGARPGSLLALWPRWVSLEWSAAMLIGGGCALVGYWRHKRSLARLGYLLIAFSCVIYACGALVVFGLQGVSGAIIFLGIAAAKVVRLLVGSAIRASLLRADQDRDRP